MWVVIGWLAMYVGVYGCILTVKQILQKHTSRQLDYVIE